MTTRDPRALEPADSNRSTYEMSDREIRALLQKHGVDVDQVSLDGATESREGAPVTDEAEPGSASGRGATGGDGADPT